MFFCFIRKKRKAAKNNPKDSAFNSTYNNSRFHGTSPNNVKGSPLKSQSNDSATSKHGGNVGGTEHASPDSISTSTWSAESSAAEKKQGSMPKVWAPRYSKENLGDVESVSFKPASLAAPTQLKAPSPADNGVSNTWRPPVGAAVAPVHFTLHGTEQPAHAIDNSTFGTLDFSSGSFTSSTTAEPLSSDKVGLARLALSNPLHAKCVHGSKPSRTEGLSVVMEEPINMGPSPSPLTASSELTRHVLAEHRNSINAAQLLAETFGPDSASPNLAPPLPEPTRHVLPEHRNSINAAHLLAETFGPGQTSLAPPRHVLTEHQKSINAAQLLAETFGPGPATSPAPLLKPASPRVPSTTTTTASSPRSSRRGAGAGAVSSGFSFTPQSVAPLPLPPARISAAILHTQKEKPASPAVEIHSSVPVKSVAAAFAKKSTESEVAATVSSAEEITLPVPVKSVAASFASQGHQVETIPSYSHSDVHSSIPVKSVVSALDGGQAESKKFPSTQQPSCDVHVPEMTQYFSSQMQLSQCSQGPSLIPPSPLPSTKSPPSPPPPPLPPPLPSGEATSSPLSLPTATVPNAPSSTLLPPLSPLLPGTKGPSPPPPPALPSTKGPSPPRPPALPSTKGPSPPRPPPLPSTKGPSPPPPPPLPSSKGPSPPLPVTKNPAPPPPPPVPTKKSPPPPPPPNAKGGPPPPPPPPNGKGGPPSPPPPPNAKGGPPVPPPVPGTTRPPGRKGPPAPPPGAPTHVPSTSKPPQAPQDSTQDVQKLKPLHWDKVRADPAHSMVWDRVRTGSFELNEDDIAALFGTKPSASKEASKAPMPAKKKGILDSKKAQNIAIQLRALNISTQEICDALLEGSGLKAELLEVLVKMAPTQEEQKSLLDFSGDTSELGPAERFLRAVLEIPNAFQRLQAMQYKASFEDELARVQELLKILEAACVEVRENRLFLKLLEAVLKTGNRMNKGTNRGEAEAFKLDTLLKLSDVKSADGKTTLLHFVTEEIIKSEGLKVTSEGKDGEAVLEGQKNEKDIKKRGLEVVWKLCSELGSIKNAALVDADALNQSVAKLSTGLASIQNRLKTSFTTRPPGDVVGTADTFGAHIEAFCSKAEMDVAKLKEDVGAVFEKVKRVTAYFHGNSREAQPLHLFIIVRDFLEMLVKVCKDLARPLKMNLRA